MSDFYLPIISESTLGKIQKENLSFSNVPNFILYSGFLSKGPFTLSNNDVVCYVENSFEFTQIVESGMTPLIPYNDINLINNAILNNIQFGIYGDTFYYLQDNQSLIAPNSPFAIFKAFKNTAEDLLKYYSDNCGYRIIEDNEGLSPIAVAGMKKSPYVNLYINRGYSISMNKIKLPEEDNIKFKDSMTALSKWVKNQTYVLHNPNDCFGCNNLLSKSSFNFDTIKNFAVIHNIKSIADSL